MKKSLLLATFLCIFSIGFAQSELLVQSSDKGMFINHTVAAKENYYSIGRMYHIAPKDIETFNGLDMTKGLVIGQTVRIPLNVSNFSQTGDKGRPVVYVVGEKEGLYRVSLKNNNVLMANLRKWNHLASDNISAGKKLIVGYLTTAETPVAAPATAATATVPASPAVEKKEEPKKETAARETPRKEEPAVVKEGDKKAEAPARNEVSKTASYTNNKPVSDGNGGYFKPLFERQVKAQPAKVDETATAGIFKTASGWQDAKYYALMDGVEPGTIIRIINPTNSKAVYAKVLGEMSGIRQNQGYNLRLSNAAATALEVGDNEKFVVKVNY